MASLNAAAPKPVKPLGFGFSIPKRAANDSKPARAAPFAASVPGPSFSVISAPSVAVAEAPRSYSPPISSSPLHAQATQAVEHTRKLELEMHVSSGEVLTGTGEAGLLPPARASSGSNPLVPSAHSPTDESNNVDRCHEVVATASGAGNVAGIAIAAHQPVHGQPHHLPQAPFGRQEPSPHTASSGNNTCALAMRRDSSDISIAAAACGAAAGDSASSSAASGAGDGGAGLDGRDPHVRARSGFDVAGVVAAEGMPFSIDAAAASPRRSQSGSLIASQPEVTWGSSTAAQHQPASQSGALLPQEHHSSWVRSVTLTATAPDASETGGGAAVGGSQAALSAFAAQSASAAFVSTGGMASGLSMGQASGFSMGVTDGASSEAARLSQLPQGMELDEGRVGAPDSAPSDNVNAVSLLSSATAGGGVNPGASAMSRSDGGASDRVLAAATTAVVARKRDGCRDITEFELLNALGAGRYG